MPRRQGSTAPLLALALALSGNACGAALSPASRVPPNPAETVAIPAESVAETVGAGVRIQVTSNGWHTDIVVPRDEDVMRAIPEAADFPTARHLSFGWGDAEFYRAPDPGLAMTLRAALAPTPAVVHLVGLRRHPGEAFPSVEVIDVTLTARRYRALLGYLAAAFEREGRKRAEAVGPGLYSYSRFYPGSGEFHLFNTCNTWTANALVAAGVLASADGIIRAEGLMSRLRGP